MNPNVKFKYPKLRLLVIIPAFFYCLFLIFVISNFMPVYHPFIATCVITFGTLGLLALIDGSYLYFKYKKLFSKHNFTSIRDIIIATNGEYEDFKKIDLHLRTLLDGNFMSGFTVRMNKDGSFEFADRNYYQNNAKKKHVKFEQPKQKTTPKNDSVLSQQLSSKLDLNASTSEQIKKALELIENGTITEEDIMNAPEPTPAQELEIMATLHKEGMISNEEFQKIKNNILKHL